MKTLPELIKTYGISLSTEFKPGIGFVPTGKLLVARADAARRNGDFAEIVSNKPEILSILKEKAEEEKKAAAAHKQKIDSIPGLKEIRAAREDMEKWHQEFNASFDDVGGLGVRKKPEYDFTAMCEKYPVANAYLTAEAYAGSSNYAKSAAGEKALDAIINGADPAETIEAMEAEWNAYCENNIWD